MPEGGLMLLDHDGRHRVMGTGRADYIRIISHDLTAHLLLLPFSWWMLLGGHAIESVNWIL